MESVLLAFAAFLLALVIVQLALPAFNALAGTAIHIPYTSPIFWLLMMGYIYLRVAWPAADRHFIFLRFNR
jgi:putative ABC transport system permease protein